MKKCFKCGIEKDLSEFYVHKKMGDGHLGKCKECTKKDATKHRDENIEKIREYDRGRASLPKRRESVARITKYHREKHPDRYKAQTAVHNAIRDGKLFRLPCFVCGALKVEGHHPDYSRPLDVVWLCPIHHKEIHLKHQR
jgi:hypothetical protein